MSLDPAKRKIIDSKVPCSGNGKIFTGFNPSVQCLLASLNVWLLVLLSPSRSQIPLRSRNPVIISEWYGEALTDCFSFCFCHGLERPVIGHVLMYW